MTCKHTTATLLLKAGVPLATMQRLLRHSDPAITTEVYGHLDVENMRRGINQLAFQADQPTEAPRLAARDATLRLLLVCCGRAPGKKQKPWSFNGGP